MKLFQIGKKFLCFYLLFIVVFITSCVSSYVRVKTKGILNKDAIHLDTLCIVEPFSKVYITSDNSLFYNSTYANFTLFNNTVAPCWKLFPEGKEQLDNYIISSLEKYFTNFKYKPIVIFDSEDSAVVYRQIEAIKQKLKDSIVTELKMSDSLVITLKKYRYKQFLITDVIEYYFKIQMFQGNIFTWYRFFMFDVTSQKLSFYDYQFACTYMSPMAMKNGMFSYWYTFDRHWTFDIFIKKFNRRVKHAKKWRRSLMNRVNHDGYMDIAF